ATLNNNAIDLAATAIAPPSNINRVNNPDATFTENGPEAFSGLDALAQASAELSFNEATAERNFTVATGDGPVDTSEDPLYGSRIASRILWENDVGNDGRSAHEVVIDWISNFSNYENWKGTGNGGVRKDFYLKEIVKILHDNGQTTRTVPTLRSKIADIERKYKKAIDWLRQTGQGIKDRVAEGSMEREQAQAQITAHVHSICPDFEVLHRVMGERASTNPLAIVDTSNDIPLPTQDANTNNNNNAVGGTAQPYGGYRSNAFPRATAAAYHTLANPTAINVNSHGVNNNEQDNTNQQENDLGEMMDSIGNLNNDNTFGEVNINNRMGNSNGNNNVNGTNGGGRSNIRQAEVSANPSASNRAPLKPANPVRNSISSSRKRGSGAADSLEAFHATTAENDTKRLRVEEERWLVEKKRDEREQQLRIEEERWAEEKKREKLKFKLEKNKMEMDLKLENLKVVKEVLDVRDHLMALGYSKEEAIAAAPLASEEPNRKHRPPSLAAKSVGVSDPSSPADSGSDDASSPETDYGGDENLGVAI
ncbi:hypothetical protein HDU76_006402, partial [Blyttiomyces sp. JEL0837]